MSGICGWYHSPSSADVDAPEAVLGRMVAALGSGGDRRMHARRASATGGLALRSGSVNDHVDDRTCCIVVGHPFLSLTPADEYRRATACDIARAFDHQGRGFLASLHGHFALAITRPDEVLIVGDRVGVHPMTYLFRNGQLVFGSRAEAIHAHPAGAPRLRMQALLNYVHFHMVPGPGTMFEDMHRLPPGGYVHVRGDRLEAGRYWTVGYEEDRGTSFGELKRDFRRTLQTVVADAAGGAAEPPDRVGCFMSGGTDSSTVAGMLCKVQGAPARTYSIGFAVEGYDEMHYARLAASHFGTRHHEYYVTPDDVLAAVPRIVAAYDQPFANASAVPTYFCAQLAKDDGVDVLLGGDGGDELFGGNERYATQTILSWYQRVPRVVQSFALEPLLASVPTGGVTLLRKAKSYVAQANVPMPDRYHAYSLLSRFGPANVFTPDACAKMNADEPLELLRDEFANVAQASLINQMLAIDLRFTLADNDLPKVSRMCEMAGIDVRYPLLDDRVLDFSTRLPSDMKLRGTKLRYFFKEALRDFLPAGIIAKQKHGFGLPIGQWLLTHPPLRTLASTSLEALKSRRIFRADFVDRMLHGLEHEHAAYYGAQVWMLLVLELWMRRFDH